jgi:transmembrane sensor
MGKTGRNINSDDERLFDQRLANAFSDMSVPRGIGKEAAWEKLAGAIEGQKEKYTGKSNLFFNKTVFSFAASVAFIIFSASMYYMFLLEKKITAGHGQLVTYTLPDNSSVSLNAGSTIHFKKHGWKKNRLLHLDGEAFFEILPGSKFTVATNNGSVSVVGTSFNVYSRKSNLTVLCKTGVVSVNVPRKGFSENLVAGKGIKINADSETLSYEKFEASTVKSSAWLTGEFYYDKAPLAEVFEEIERQYDIKIYADHLSHRHYTGYFKKGDLKQTLDMVCLPMNLSYRVKNNKSVYIE